MQLLRDNNQHQEGKRPYPFCSSTVCCCGSKGFICPVFVIEGRGNGGLLAKNQTASTRPYSGRRAAQECSGSQKVSLVSYVDMVSNGFAGQKRLAVCDCDLLWTGAGYRTSEQLGEYLGDD